MLLGFVNSGEGRRTQDRPAAVPAFLRSPVKFIAHYVRARAWHFVALACMVTGAATCAVGVQYGMKLLVDAMAGAPDGRTAVWRTLALFMGLIATESLLWRLSGWLGCRTTIGTGVDIRLDLFGYLTGHPMRYFQDKQAGSLGHRITATAGSFGALSNTVVWRIAPPCIDFLGALIVFLTVDWHMAVALAGFIVLVTGGLILFGARGRPRHQAYAEHAGAVGGELVDVIANIWAVKAFAARASELARLRDKFQEEAAAQQRSWMHTEKARVMHDVALWVLAGSMLAWAIHLWSRGRISPGDVVVVSALSFRILHGSRDLALALIEMVQHFGYIAETLRVIGQSHAVCDALDARLLMRLGGAIDLDSVSFAYTDGRQAVRNVSLSIPAGQKVGIVGPSGAGKSTVVNLVQRLYDVQRGRILIDGQPVTGLTQDSLRAAIAVVPQEITLFHRTIMENIRFGRPDASDAEVYAAAEAAHCHDFIRALPHGYDTVVGERGTKLSGGQRQRVGIARAFLKDAAILILDEATSALDTESEIEVQRALIQLMGNRTVLAVAHRLSTLVSFDRVVVMVDGRIVEDGSPMDIRRDGGVFEHMWRLQIERFSAGTHQMPT